ncbi:AT-hook motif nuclear-localized protein 1-like [Benincasa hispida]|uniref:AT-hook motif nuclear-localized protein 1-like n=1 Tax=Benincasa hispida TaxID=102211 RepID=UPI001902394E|nr:AT-hook motif nuclear-localized protein 1-like [Benincasa hispida]
MAEKPGNRAPSKNNVMTNPILLAKDRNKPTRDYAWPNLYDFSLEIMRPSLDGSIFEMKSVMLQMIQTARQFGGLKMEDDQNKINETSPQFKAPLESIMEDRPLSSMAADLTSAIPAIPISVVPAATARRRRGRPASPRRPRTTNPILASLGGIAMSGHNLRPHRITIYRAQNIVDKIVAFCKEGHQGAIVLSASGGAVISSVTLRGTKSQDEISLEGSFEILSLTGRFIESESESASEVRGRLHLTTSLVLQDMSVIGGIITGPLIAASRMSILMGTIDPITSNNPQADMIPLATNLNITEPSSHFDASASCSKFNINN